MAIALAVLDVDHAQHGDLGHPAHAVERGLLAVDQAFLGHVLEQRLERDLLLAEEPEGLARSRACRQGLGRLDEFEDLLAAGKAARRALFFLASSGYGDCRSSTQAAPRAHCAGSPPLAYAARSKPVSRDTNEQADCRRPARRYRPLDVACLAAGVLDTMGPILAEAADAATLDAKCDRYVAEIETRRTALEGESGPATLDGTLTRYDEITALINGGLGEFTLYQQVMADQPRRDAGANCQVRLSALGSKLSLSRPIYDRLKAIDGVPPTPRPRSTCRARCRGSSARASRSTKRSGGGCRSSTSSSPSSAPSSTTNIANGRRLSRSTRPDSPGLPADFIAAHQPGGDGKVEISTDTPDYQPVMTYAESDALRRQLSEVYNRRAYPANDAVLRQIFTLRQELATILGGRTTQRWCSRTKWSTPRPRSAAA